MNIDQIINCLEEIRGNRNVDIEVFFTYVDGDRSYNYQLNDMNGMLINYDNMTIYLDKREF